MSHEQQPQCATPHGGVGQMNQQVRVTAVAVWVCVAKGRRMTLTETAAQLAIAPERAHTVLVDPFTASARAR
jgi:hypothetical protein